jgi:hypothetical protein
MCNSCGSKQYGQSQVDARKADQAKLDKIREKRESKSARRDNAHLN